MNAMENKVTLDLFTSKLARKHRKIFGRLDMYVIKGGKIVPKSALKKKKK